MFRRIIAAFSAALVLCTGISPVMAETDYSAYTTEELLAMAAGVSAELNSRATGQAEDSAKANFLYAGNGKQIQIRTYIGEGGLMVIPAEIDGVPVTHIGEEAFRGNKTITGVVLPDGLLVIGNTAFYTRTLTGTVTLPPSLRVADYESFLLTNVTGVYVLSENCTIGRRAFENTPAEFLYIREGCKVALDQNSFAYSGEMLYAVIPASVTSIHSDAFQTCPKLTIVTPPGSYAERYAQKHFIPCNTADYDQYVAKYEAQLLEDTAAALQ